MPRNNHSKNVRQQYQFEISTLALVWFKIIPIISIVFIIEQIFYLQNSFFLKHGLHRSLKNGVKERKRRTNIVKVPSKKKPPLLRARTLPAIICPSLNIIQAQLEADRDASADAQGKAEGKPRRHFSGSAVIKKTAVQERERCYLDPEIEPAKSPSGSPRASVTSVTSSGSTQSSGKDITKQKYESTKAGLSRLAKLLTSKDKSSSNKNTCQFPSTIPNIEVTPLRRSGSVDSLLDTSMYPTDLSDLSNSSSMACLAPSCSSVNLLSPLNQSPTGSLTVPNDGRTIPTSPSVPAKLEAHRRGDIPSSPSVPNKLTKGLSGQCLGTPEVFLEGLPLSKAERKRLEKLNKINIDLQALFVAVEHEQIERARTILSTTDVDVNWIAFKQSSLQVTQPEKEVEKEDSNWNTEEITKRDSNSDHESSF